MHHKRQIIASGEPDKTGLHSEDSYLIVNIGEVPDVSDLVAQVLQESAKGEQFETWRYKPDQ
jgi:hypothetical protein